MKNFLLWWVIFCSILFGTYESYSCGFFDIIFNDDKTKLTFLSFGIFYITTLIIGYKTWIENVKHKSVSHHIEWYITETLMAVGILGTVSGFIMMTKNGFNANVGDLQNSLKEMSQGMSTALYNTIVGLTGSILLRLQLVVVEGNNENS